MQKPSDSTLVFIKFTRAIVYIVYAFTIIAVVSLTFGFFLLLFGANLNTPFVQFVYNIANEFMAPFRGIFNTHAVGQTGYFSASALFAIIVYLVFAAAVSSLISYLSVKMVKHQTELEDYEKTNKTTKK